MTLTLQKVLIPVEAGYQTVDVQLNGETIQAIGSQLDPVGTLVNGENKLLLPGFVNAHTHSPEMWVRGAIPPYPLELWLAQLYDALPLTPEHVYLSGLGTAVETLLSGGTTVVDHLVLIPGQELATIEAAVRAYRQAGIRAFIGPLIQDESLPASMPGSKVLRPDPYLRTTAATLGILEEVIHLYHRPDEGIQIMTAPTGLQLCSDALFTGCVELSDRFGLARHTHLLETKAQQMLAHEKHGCSGVEHLQRLGFLNERTSLAHCVWLTDRDIAILAETGSTVVHNPLSNLRLGSGIAPVLKYRAAGVNVTFGCDGSSSNDSQDLLEAIKIGSILHCVTDFDYRHWLTPRHSIDMASRGGALGLGIADQVGTLAVGQKADLVLYDLTSLSLLPQTDPVGMLMLGRPTQAVDAVWVNGKQVISDGKLLTYSLTDLRQQLFSLSQGFRLPVPSPMVQAMEPHYRQIMGLPD